MVMGCTLLWLYRRRWVVGEDEQVAEELESLPDDFAGHEDGREFLLNLLDVDLRGVSEEGGDASSPKSRGFQFRICLNDSLRRHWKSKCLRDFLFVAEIDVMHI